MPRNRSILSHLVPKLPFGNPTPPGNAPDHGEFELEPLNSSIQQHPTSKPSAFVLELLERLGRGVPMKFSHSLVFNSVPEWTSHYLNYENLKSTIYKFERSSLLPQPPAQPYTDAEPTPSDLEASSQAVSAEVQTSATQEKIFTRLLDQEVHKMTTFYTAKEAELLDDLKNLVDDIARVEDEQDDYDGVSSRGGVSGASDSEGGSEDEMEEEEGGVAARTSKLLKSALTTVFSNPKQYDAAARAGRRRGASSASGKSPGGRRRAYSQLSTTESDLLDLREDDDEAARAGETQLTIQPTNKLSAEPLRPSEASPVTPTKRGPAFATLGRRLSRSNDSPANRRRSRTVATMGSEEDDGMFGTSDWAIDTKIMFKRRLTAVFTALSELKQYVNLNYTGLSKIIKKYDKITNSSLRAKYMADVVDQSYPFSKATQTGLTEAINSLVPLYANLSTGGDTDAALKQLKAQLREHVVWERNTVWREMIGLERKGWTTAGRSAGSKNTGMEVPMVDHKSDQPSRSWWAEPQVWTGSAAILLFLGILSADWFDRVEEQNCLALLVFVTIFWALEIVPLFVTAFMVPFFVVVLRVLRSTDGEDRRLTASESTKYMFSQMFSPTIMLLLGGFTLAAALSKQNIDKVLATKILSFAGTRPSSVLLAYMGVACFASMWISNVAAPVLCYSLIQPILRTLPSKSPFAKALILGIALSANIGGMASPISSPQNLIALEYMNPPISWLGWFAVSIPISIVSILLIWIILLWMYRAGKGVVINPVRVSRETWTVSQWFVSIVTLATIFLWCVESKLAWILGDMGIIAIIPIVLFYGTGILRKADFDHSPWSIVFLAMGGIGLGKAVLSSGLLDDMDRVIEHVVLGLDIWPILALFSIVVLVIATLISHTIASVLVVPIAAQIGAAMEVPHPRLLILSTALICSAGMGLPISGFPNLQAINQENDLGERYLEPSDFFKTGIPASILAVVVITTLGFGIMRAMGM
ncbi:SPX-domain-containing protein [Meredithblackwellia eburnea MCA 4105]